MELFWIYDGRIHPVNQQRETDHSHGYWIWFVRRGSVEVKQGKAVLMAKAGKCLVSPRGHMQQSFSSDAHILSIHFGCEWPTGDGLFVDQSGCVFKSADYPDFANKAQEMADFVKSYFPIESPAHFGEGSITHSAFLRLQRYFIEWLEIFSRTLSAQGYTFSQVSSIDERLVRAVRCLKEASFDGNFPATLMQQETGLGRSQLDRLFSQTFGLSPRSYWINRKLAIAKSLLTSTPKPIKEVGFRLGFKQASHFTAWFSERVGMAPMSYRQREAFLAAPCGSSK
jgi:AraC-like DNA-binding protein